MLTAAFRSSTSPAVKAQALSRHVTSQSIFRFFGVESITEDDEKAADVAEPVVKSKQPKFESKFPRPATVVDYNDLPITFADISRAEVAIRGGVVRTTCEKSHFISELIGAEVYFKNEFRQFTGSFKERGARNAILTLKRQKGKSLKGVIAAR
jgi:threonine dehydratase